MRPKGVIDAQQVNIPALPVSLTVRSDGFVDHTKALKMLEIKATAANVYVKQVPRKTLMGEGHPYRKPTQVSEMSILRRVS